MTHIYTKIRDYRLNNKGRAKGFIDMVELILVSLILPLFHMDHQDLFIPEMDVKIIRGYFLLCLYTDFMVCPFQDICHGQNTQDTALSDHDFPVCQNSFYYFYRTAGREVTFQAYFPACSVHHCVCDDHVCCHGIFSGDWHMWH